MKYKSIIFDLDGTLLDTLEDLKDSVNAALVKNEMPERTSEEIRAFVGNGIGKLIQRAIPDGTDDFLFQMVFDDFCKHYERHCQDKTKLYPGIRSLLEKLKEHGLKMAIVSNKADFAVKELRASFFSDLIENAYGETEKVKRKPSPDMVIYALNDLGCSVEESVYVGDSDVDIQTAKNANIDCISVSWGFRGIDFLKKNGASKIVNSPNEILSIIL